MAKNINEKNKNAFNDEEPLCCNFAAWGDGKVTCDIMIGNMTTKHQPDLDTYQFSSTYTFVLDAKASDDFDIIGTGESKVN